MEIKGKVGVITGAASGICRALAYQLADKGVSALALVDASEAVEDVAEEIRRRPGTETQAVAYVGDVTEESFRERVFDEVTDTYGLPRICVPGAGVTRDALAVKIDKDSGETRVYPIDRFREVIEVDLIAPVYWAMQMIAKHAEDRRERGRQRWDPEEGIQGTVIFIGSISSQGNKGQTAYSAAKSGLEGAAATLMKEAIFHGVRCGVIHPGFTDTPMVRQLGEEFIEKHILPQTQLRRLIRPDEIADGICFLIGNSAASGELWADAGWHPSA